MRDHTYRSTDEATYTDRDRDGVADVHERDDRIEADDPRAVSERTIVDDRRIVIPDRSRGGVSLASILTGVAVALGAMVVLSALVGGIAAAVDEVGDAVEGATATEVGIGIGIAVALVTFIAYLWGGYTAGRMARGAGALNGVLVPIAALVIAGILAGVVALLTDANAELVVPFRETRLWTGEEGVLVDLGIGIGIATLVAMLLGGLLGGMWGARWHTKLEDRSMNDRLDDSNTAYRRV